jgi:hypothetical protein
LSAEKDCAWIAYHGKGGVMHEMERLHLEASKGEDDPIFWPPDIFAVCCYFSKISGIYRSYSDSNDRTRRRVDNAIKDGEKWRNLLDENISPAKNKIPSRIKSAWARIGKKIPRPMAALTSDADFIEDVLYLIACSDEACVGVGIPNFLDQSGRKGYFEFFAELAISEAGSLCRNVDPLSVRVLPKQHTPQSGFNVRSLTHHLALYGSSEVVPVWTQAPIRISESTSFNILLAPWPTQINASDVKPSRRQVGCTGFGYFDYDPRIVSGENGVADWVRRLLSYTLKISQKIDLLLLPECAIALEEWSTLADLAGEFKLTIVSGVRGLPSNGTIDVGDNMLKVKLPSLPDFELTQYKHHRWKLDAGQIENYGFGGTLDAGQEWWENINIHERKLNFLAVRPELVICPLICEDLARQDPVAELVRSVGPNLVIALLMDGPQIAERWSARYATVLADDPGCSVLTLSSLGMVNLSRSYEKPQKRVVACWKEASGKFVPLELAASDDGMILNLQFKTRHEWSLDGRDDGGVASMPVLRGTHPINLRGM